MKVQSVLRGERRRRVFLRAKLASEALAKCTDRGRAEEVHVGGCPQKEAGLWALALATEGAGHGTGS